MKGDDGEGLPLGLGGVHQMAVHSSDERQRTLVLAWVADALRRGDKVLFKHHRSRSGASPGWPGLGALATGPRRADQLELIDAQRLHEDTGGAPEALWDLHVDLLDQARRRGYPAVALTGDAAAMRVICPDPALRDAHERDLEWLASRPGLRVLCCYDLRREEPATINRLLRLHRRGVADERWSAERSDETLELHGEIDLSNAHRVETVLDAAFGDGVRRLDLSDVTFLSAAGIRALAQAAGRPATSRGGVELVGASPVVLRMIGIAHALGDDISRRTGRADSGRGRFLVPPA